MSRRPGRRRPRRLDDRRLGASHDRGSSFIDTSTEWSSGPRSVHRSTATAPPERRRSDAVAGARNDDVSNLLTPKASSNHSTSCPIELEGTRRCGVVAEALPDRRWRCRSRSSLRTPAAEERLDRRRSATTAGRPRSPRSPRPARRRTRASALSAAPTCDRRRHRPQLEPGQRIEPGLAGGVGVGPEN